MKLFTVSAQGPLWRGHRYHYMVAATDHIDAARKGFLLVKDYLDKKKRPAWASTKTMPESWKVWQVMDAKTFDEELQHVRFDDEVDEDTRSTWDSISDLLIDGREIRL